jgi:hypothetical protein
VPSTSIIDLTISNEALGPLDSWELGQPGLTTSDHLVIWASWEPPEEEANHREAMVTGWDVSRLMGHAEEIEAAEHTWERLTSPYPGLTDNCSAGEIEDEAVLVENSLIGVLKAHAREIRLCARSKRWWGPRTMEARGIYTKAYKAYHTGELSEEDHREARRAYYATIRQAKRDCWEAFLQGADEGSRAEEKRCWVALRYTKPTTYSTTPALLDPDTGQVIVATFEEKEAIFREQAFPQAPEDDPGEAFQGIELPGPGNAHNLIAESAVRNAIFSQGVDKAPGVDLLNFRAIRLLWQLDQARVIALIRQCIRLGVHPGTWKTAKGVLLRKPNKSRYTIAKHYRVISLLKCLGKVVERLVAELITEFAESRGLFHEGQFGGRQRRSAVDAVACLIGEIEHAWGNHKVGACLFMDIQGAFDHVVRSKLIGGLREAKLDADLIRWVASFLTNRRAFLVIDGHPGIEAPINSGLPQGTPVSPILFVLYVRLLATAIETAVPGVKGLSFMDDQGLVTAAKSIKEACKTLQRAAKIAVEWGLENGVQFDPDKTELAFFTRMRESRFREEIRGARVTVRGVVAKVMPDTVRWLGIILDRKLTLQCHYKICL